MVTAVNLAERGTALNPIERDAVAGPQSLEVLVRVEALGGQANRAVSILQQLLAVPEAGFLAGNAPLTPALLRLDPMSDSLRSDPHFEKIVASLGPQK